MTASMRAAAVYGAIAAAACTPATSRPHLVARWNQEALATSHAAAHRTLAMVHIAMFDAVNAIEGLYTPYQSLPDPPAPVIAEAAVAAAAHGVLVRLFPQRRQTLATMLADTLLNVPEGQRKSESLRYGDLVAQTIYESRRADQIVTHGPAFIQDSTPGRYQLTIPGPSQPVNRNASNWRPFALRSASQFRPPKPPSLNSATYTRDFAEVLHVGGSTSRERTLEQEEIARWHTEPVAQQWNRIAREETNVDGKDLLEHARLFALLNVTLADAYASVFEAKHEYLLWRPVTAIHQAGNDGNPATLPDAAWSSFVLTPPHPEFPSEQGVLRFAGAEVMTAYFGEPYAFQTTSSSVPGLTRSYATFKAFAAEGAQAGVLGGVHFRTTVERAALQGRSIATWVLGHYLLPVASE